MIPSKRFNPPLDDPIVAINSEYCGMNDVPKRLCVSVTLDVRLYETRVIEFGVPIKARCTQCLLKVALPDGNVVLDGLKSSTREVDVVGCRRMVL